VQELVDDAPAELLDGLQLLLGHAVPQLAHGLLQLLGPDVLRLAPQRLQTHSNAFSVPVCAQRRLIVRSHSSPRSLRECVYSGGGVLVQEGLMLVQELKR